MFRFDERDRDESRTVARPRLARRQLLTGMALGGAAAAIPSFAMARSGGGCPFTGVAGTSEAQTAALTAEDMGTFDVAPDRFTRIFREHPPFVEPSDELREALTEIGRPGGMLDAGDPLFVGAEELVTRPELSPGNRVHPTQPAGATFMGQFIDHDLTADAGSRLGNTDSVARSMNLRTARLDLDSVYGGGPEASPELYETGDPFRLRVESGGRFEDLPRDGEGRAIIGDDRNDENLIVSGLHAGFLMAHNAVLQRVRAEAGGDPMADAVLEEAVRTLRWHYQWIIVHEELRQFAGDEMVDDVLAHGRRHYRPTQARIPVEFQTSAYRFGHSMVAPAYRANLMGNDGRPFFAPLFDPETLGQPDPADLGGGSRAARRYVGWQSFFDFGDGSVTFAKRIDTKLSTPLFQLPTRTIASGRADDVGPLSLATRNLLRHITWGIPSGQAVTAEMGAEPLAAGDLDDVRAVAPALADATPLWLYILREAELVAEGLHLGPVGGRLVAEVLIGLLELDPTSYLSAEPGWRPTLPSRLGDGEFDMVDLLTLAGVDPDSRGE